MRIAVNTRLLLKDKLEGIGWFTFETLKRIVKNHPEHTFYFIFDRPYDKQFLFSENVIPVKTGIPTRHPFLYILWFEFFIPRILKKINADLFISPDGYLSLTSKVKSVAVIHDINFMHYPKDFPFFIKNYYRYFFPRFAKKARRIITVSEYSKQDISKTFNINPKLIDLAYNGANTIYNPINLDKQKETRDKYSHGKQFFLFVGALSPRKNISNLLLAFDKFKSRSKSDTKLIIVGKKMFKTNNLENTYKKLKHKKDVLFAGRMSPDNLKNLYGAALALTFVPYFEGFGIPIIEAMNCETPVITSNVTSMPEIAGDAALLIDPFSVNDISDAMIQLFENNDLRSELILKAKQRAKNFSWDKTAERFWESIEKVIYE